MEEHIQKKMERYLRNSERFLWGTGTPTKKIAPKTYQNTYYDCVRANGFDFDNGTYSRVTEYLILRYGVEDILERHVVTSVQQKFPEETIDMLRHYWMNGTCPSLTSINNLPIKGDYTRKLTMIKWIPFLNIDVKPKREQGKLEYDYYVKSWNEFAGIWFEEIEPWLKKKND